MQSKLLHIIMTLGELTHASTVQNPTSAVFLYDTTLKTKAYMTPVTFGCYIDEFVY